MAYCDSIINQGIENPCSVKKGVQRVGKIINRSGITGVGVVPSGNILDSITGSQAYDVVVPGNNPYEGLAQNIETGTYTNNATTDVPIVILSNDPTTAKLIKGLMNGSYVLVLENNDAGTDGNGKYQVYGWENGLRATSAQREPYGDNPGWLVTLHEEGANEAGIFLKQSGWTAL